MTHFYPAFTDLLRSAQKAVLDLSCQGVSGWAGGGFKDAALATDWLTARAHCKGRHTTTKTVACKKVKMVQTVGHDLARTEHHRAWLAESDTLEKVTGRGIQAPPQRHP